MYRFEAVGVLCVLALLVSGCPADLAGDDDSAPIDDDDSALDDPAPDDDADDDDDWTTVEPFWFSFSFVMTVDDEPAGDDDDSAGPISRSVSMEYVLTLWWDIYAGVGGCEQHLVVQGQLLDGPGPVEGCADCAGLALFDRTTVVDVSDPAADPDHCYPSEMVGALGVPAELLVTPAMGGYGDFLSLALMEADVVAGLELPNHPDAAGWVQEQREELASYDLELTHLGLVQASPGSFTGGSGISTLSDAPEPESDWYFFWSVTAPQGQPGGENLAGERLGWGLWLVTFPGL